MKGTDVKREFLKLRADGMSYEKIAARLNVSRATLRRWAEEMQDELTKLKQEHLQDLYDEYGMMRAARMERLGKAINQLQDAIEKADLSKIPPERLFDLLLKYQDAMRNEERWADEQWNYNPPSC